jgi:sulfur-carrier protein
MPRVSFTPHLQLHLDCPPRDVAGETVRAVLDNLFVEQPKLRSYIVDDQGAVRKHVVIFVDDQMIADREKQSDVVKPESEIFVLQALSGG